AAVALNDGAADGQAKPEPAGLHLTAKCAAEGWLEDAAKLLDRDADPAVRDRDACRIRAAEESHGDRSATWRVRRGIDEHVVDDLLHLLRVMAGFDRLRRVEGD